MALSAQSRVRSAPPKPSLWRNQAVRAIAYQVIAIGVVVGVAAFLIHNTLENLATRNIATGFGFLNQESGFPIGESLVPFSPTDTYGRALYVGFLNTIQVSALGIVIATLLGVTIGIARLSKNWLVAKLASTYVELVRNTPVLLQLFFWYSLLTEALPAARNAATPLGAGAGVFVTNRGVRLPELLGHPIHQWMGLLFLVGIGLVWLWSRHVRRTQAATGRRLPLALPALGLLCGPALLVWLIAGAPLAVEMPVLRGFNFQGGLTITPELIALLIGLSIYTAAFIAENVRGGILAVSWGQSEAARALGLSAGQTMRLVVLPQALRVIIPPTTSQYLNLTKNSSLALAIGYPDLVSVANTTLNQTGQAIEGIAIVMGVYLTISLAISMFMNWYNQRIKLIER